MLKVKWNVLKVLFLYISNFKIVFEIILYKKLYLYVYITIKNLLILLSFKFGLTLSKRNLQLVNIIQSLNHLKIVICLLILKKDT